MGSPDDLQASNAARGFARHRGRNAFAARSRAPPAMPHVGPGCHLGVGMLLDAPNEFVVPRQPEEQQPGVA